MESDESTALSDTTFQYLLQEANLIGERIQWYLEQQQQLETLAIIGSGAIWSFLLSLNYTSAVNLMAWLPGAITALLAIKSLIFTKTLNEAFNYLYQLEVMCELPGDTGWVHFFRARSAKYKRRWRTGFWLVITTANLLVALLVPFDEFLTSITKP